MVNYPAVFRLVLPFICDRQADIPTGARPKRNDSFDQPKFICISPRPLPPVLCMLLVYSILGIKRWMLVGCLLVIHEIFFSYRRQIGKSTAMGVPDFWILFDHVRTGIMGQSLPMFSSVHVGCWTNQVIMTISLMIAFDPSHS